MSVQIRRDPADTWTAADITLAAGEMACESDTGKMKVGDGTNKWTKLDYAATTISFSPAGETNGYICGGQDPDTTNRIQKHVFANSSNAVDHGDLHTSAKGTSTTSNKAGSTIYTCTSSTAVSKFSATSNTTASTGDVTLNPGSGEERVGLNNDTKGYIVGGENHNKMDRFPFAAEGTASDIGNMLEPNNNGAQYATQSTTHGYAAGAKPSSGTYGNSIGKFPFASEGDMADVSNMTAAKYGGGGGIGPTHGFLHGGYPPNINVIESFPFAAEGNSADVADLHEARGAGASMSSQTNAYLCGGYPSDKIQRYPTAAGTAGAGTDHGNLLASVFNSSGGFL